MTSGRRATAASRPCEGVSLEVRAGEIVAVAGVAGNGQRELAETIAGIRAKTAGTFACPGHELRGGDPRAAIARRDRLRPGGPARDRCRAEPQHRVEPRAQVLPRARRSRWGPLLRLGADPRRAPSSLIRRYAIAAPGPGGAGAACSRAATSRRSCSPASSRASRSCSSRPRRRAASTSVRSRRCTPTFARRRPRASRVLLISEDLDEILHARRPDRRHVRGRDPRRVLVGGGGRRGDRPADGRRRRGHDED